MKPTTLREARQALAAARDKANVFLKEFTVDGELKMGAEKVSEFRSMNDEMTELGKLVDGFAAAEEIAASVATYEREEKSAGSGRSLVPNGDGRPARAETREFGTILRENVGYKQFRANGLRGTAVIELNDAEAKTLMTLSDFAVPPTRRAGVVESVQNRVSIVDLLLPGSIDGPSLTYLEETTFTNAAAETAEAGLKPEAALDYTERTDNVKKIAAWIPVTSETLADVSAAQSMIEGRLSYMVAQRLNSQLLVGDGTGANLLGIMNRTGIQTQAKGADPTPDAIYKAVTKVRIGGDAEPTAIVLHPNDWQDIRLLRTADGAYLFGGPADDAPERIWGFDVRSTVGITENTGLVGAFRPHGQFFLREGLRIIISTEHADFFIYNKVAILAEMRGLLAVYRAAAFCKVTGI